MHGRLVLVGAQHRFAADAAHELRTPLAVQRAAAEVGPAGEPEPVKAARIRERLIAVAGSSEHLAAAAGVDAAGDLTPLTVSGDGTLLGHLVRNLPADAVRHNRAGGRPGVSTAPDGVLTVSVSNPGPPMDPAEEPRLPEPFRCGPGPARPPTAV
ncbi:histidine kinase dimerization/phospho-acceptor domain-containing protein [Streptomyces sp. NPDC029003]|uniref:histidine kinase dimerization/phospho-acceptor domain-containing protein n=1 Tax=Streptomyces sp. NPDC029003 TaxID=3155125 RepID=UPI00340F03C4